MSDDLDPFPAGLAEAIENERRLLDAVSGNATGPDIERPRRVGPEADPADLIMCIVFASKSGGNGHVVSIIDTAEGRAAMCICEAMRNLQRRPKGCWAMAAARTIVGLEQPR